MTEQIPTIDTGRFVLRCLTEDDVTDRYISWLNDPEVTRYLQARNSKHNHDSTLAYVKNHNNIDKFLFGIFDKSKDMHIGNFSLSVSLVHKTGIQGVMIGDKEYWGQGVILEARAGLLDICFGELGLFKVNGLPLASNLPAVFNYKRQAWVVEGIQSKQYLCDGKRVDGIHFSMFRDFWLEKKHA